jgi:formylglycine-generating enzyme required for sulfatase activity
MLERGAGAAVVLALVSAPCVAAQESHVDSIPGTLVRFEMIPIPGRPGYFVSRTEVTWDMYDAFALSVPDSTDRRAGADAVARPTRPYGAPDYGWGHAGFPVISVAFTAAEAFCAWLSARTGKTYRLPTESEWERLAALAASGGPLEPRLDALGWHQGNSSGRTHRVGAKERDAVGLHDLFGNAAEWVVTTAGRPATRGGSFRDPVGGIGPSARAVQDDTWNERDPQIPQSRWWLSDAPFVGFRIVREP